MLPLVAAFAFFGEWIAAANRSGQVPIGPDEGQVEARRRLFVHFPGLCRRNGRQTALPSSVLGLESEPQASSRLRNHILAGLLLPRGGRDRPDCSNTTSLFASAFSPGHRARSEQLSQLSSIHAS